MDSVYNPIKDAALMAQIGATRKCDLINNETKVILGSTYELKNAETGTTFGLWWWSKDSRHYCRIEKK